MEGAAHPAGYLMTWRTSAVHVIKREVSKEFMQTSGEGGGSVSKGKGRYQGDTDRDQLDKRYDGSGDDPEQMESVACHPSKRRYL